LSRLEGAELQLGVYENHVVFGADGTWLTTRRIDGQFPNYRQLLPEQFEHELQLPREELLDVVRRVAIMAQRNSPLRLRFAEGELTVSAVTQDVGEARESLPAPYNGEPLDIGFNAEFLRDGIDSVEGDTLRLKLISPLRTRSDAQLIRFGERAGRIAVRGRRSGSPVAVELTLRLQEGKQALLNGARLHSAEQLRRELTTLVFTPDRLAVVKGGPAIRR